MILDVFYNFDYVFFSLFLIQSYFLYASYPTMIFLLNKSEKFRACKTAKQYYIVKNILKTVSMAVISFFLIVAFIPNVISDNWNDMHNRVIGVFYVSNDLAGLFAVPNLPKSTKMHHYTTVTLFTIICSISTEHEDNIGKLIAIYTIFSCIPFMVNLFLATRFFYNKYGDQILTANQLRENQLIDYNRISAYYIYLLCCIGNWLYHGVFLLNRLWLFDFGLSYLVYYALLLPIINDDLVLLSWLKSKRLEL
jgi:hypothetical protein